MDSGRAIRLLFANGLRVIHIALWMTVPDGHSLAFGCGQR